VDIKRALRLDDDELARQLKRDDDELAHEKADADIAKTMNATEFDLTWEPLDDEDEGCDNCGNPANYRLIDDYNVTLCRACAERETDGDARGRRILEILGDEYALFNETPAQVDERARDRREWRYFTIDVAICDCCDDGARYHLRGSSRQYCPDCFPLITH
jgi:hypothetical protein